MINYSILKIKLLSIIESIDDYTSEPIVWEQLKLLVFALRTV